MDIFFSTTASFVNNLQQAANAPAQNTSTQPQKPTQETRIDFSGENTTKKNNRSGGMDSLGRGNIV